MGRTKDQARKAFKLDIARRALTNALEHRDICIEHLQRAEGAVREIEDEIAKSSTPERKSHERQRDS